MIVFHNSKGEIKGSVEGKYSLDRLDLSDKTFIEVQKQNLDGKKVENGKLVEKTKDSDEK